jgi:tripartite-type tricarboxylate transporter receptor subunit TctC
LVSRLLLGAAAALATLVPTAVLAAAHSPAPPVRVIVGFGRGAVADLLACTLGVRMTVREIRVDGGLPRDIANESQRWGDGARAAGLKK